MITPNRPGLTVVRHSPGRAPVSPGEWRWRIGSRAARKSRPFWVEGQRYCGAFNGKKGLPVAEGKEDAKDKEREVYRKVVNGTYGKEDGREHLSPVVTLALLTGMRKGEILDLRWEHVNLGAEVEQHLIKGETWNLRPG